VRINKNYQDDMDETLTSVNSWFSVNMGTGITSILLNTLPYNGKWLYWISVVVFALNVLLFATFLLMTILRYTLYPRIFAVMIRHPVQSMFIGTLPMGFATIINMFVFVCVPAWGEWTRNFAWILWILDAVVSVVTAFTLPALLYGSTHRSLNQQTDTDAFSTSQDDAHENDGIIRDNSRVVATYC